MTDDFTKCDGCKAMGPKDPLCPGCYANLGLIVRLKADLKQVTAELEECEPTDEEYAEINRSVGELFSVSRSRSASRSV